MRSSTSAAIGCILSFVGLAACGDDSGAGEGGGGASGSTSGATTSGTTAGSGAASSVGATTSSAASTTGSGTGGDDGGGGAGQGGSGDGGSGGTSSGGGHGPVGNMRREAPSYARDDDEVGSNVAIAMQGRLLAIGAEGDSNPNGGIEPDPLTGPSDHYLMGAVYLYELDDELGWSFTYIKPEEPADAAFFTYVALSADGSTLAVGAPGEGPGDGFVGAVYVFSRSGDTWVQEARISSPSTDDDFFGFPVRLSDDGDTLVIGATADDSASAGIDGDPSDDSAQDAGAVYVFGRSADEWTQQAYIKAPQVSPDDIFGAALAISGAGDLLAVGVQREGSSAIGIDGDFDDDSAPDSGAVFLYSRTGDTWELATYVKATNADAGDAFGCAVALSADGATLVVGAANEASADPGVDADPDDDSLPGAGAVYVFENDAGAWSQATYIKAPSPYDFGYLGARLALSADGATIGSTDGDIFEGAVRIWRRAGATWSLRATLLNPDGSGDAFENGFPSDFALSEDGELLVAGAPHDLGTGTFTLFDVP